MNRFRLIVASVLVLLCTAQGFAQLRMSKSSIPFGSLRATTSKVDSFYVKDTTATGTTITAATTATSRYVLSAPAGNLTPALAAGDSVWYQVTFTPDAIAGSVDTVVITHAGGSLKLPLSGTGISNLDLFRSPLAFGSVRFTVTKTDSFYVKNTTATGSSITALANAYNRYTVTARAGAPPVAVAAGDSAWFDVSFAPDVLGAKLDTVVLTHALGSLKVPMSGTGASNLDLNKTSIDYGIVKAGLTKKDSFYVKNAVGATSITSVTNLTTQFAVTAKLGNMTPSLAAGDTVWYYVTYGPDTIATKVDTVTITHPNGVLKVALRGTGITSLDVSKSTIAFGSYMVTTTKKDSLYVKNSSGISVNIASFSNRYPNRFQVSTNKGTLTPTLAAGDSAWYRVTYNSDTVAAVVDTLVFGVNNGFFRVSLSGTGTTNITSNKASLTISTYPDQPFVGLFLLKNIGTTPTAITAATLAKPQMFSVTSARGTATPTLAVNDSVVFTVGFQWDSVSTQRDTLVLTHPAGVIRIPLAGVVNNNLQLTDANNGARASVAFGNRVRGVTGIDSVKIKNFGLLPITVNSITKYTATYTLTPPTLPLTLNPTQESWMYITYTPTSNVGDADTIDVINDDAGKGAVTKIRLPMSGRALSSLRFSQGGVIIDFDATPNKDYLGISAANAGTRNGVLPLLGVAIDSPKVALVTLANAGISIIRVDSIKFQTPHFSMLTPVPFDHKPNSLGLAQYDRILQIKFQPKVNNASIIDTMFVWTNDSLPGGNPVKLIVKGASARRVYAADSLSLLTLNFGAVAYTASDARMARIMNLQDISLIVDSVALRVKNPKFSIPTPYTNVTLTGGRVDTLRVKFTANDTLPGPHLDTLMVYTNFQALPFRLPLTATVQRGIIIQPSLATINVGDIPLQSSKDTTIRLINATRKPFNIIGMTLTSGANYTILTATSAQVFNEGDTIVVRVRYTPSTGGQHRDTLVISSTIDLASLTPNPYRIALVGTGNTNALINPVDYVTVDNALGVDGFNIRSTDDSYVESGANGFFTNVGAASFGGFHRRTPNSSGSPSGAAATYTFKLDSTGPYLIYYHMVNTGNGAVNAYVHFRKFGLGAIYDSLRYTQLDVNATGYASTWLPLTAHAYDGVGERAAQVTIGADIATSNFLRVDALRMLRSRVAADIEFGRRDPAFGPVRVPEESPAITVADEYIRQYRVWNLGYDTLKITNIEVLPTTTPLAWYFIKNYTSGQVISVPPMTVDGGGVEHGGFVDIPVTFTPFQEGTARDSLVFTSNDTKEPKAYIILVGNGVNLNFVLNASLGGTEPHFRAPAPPAVSTIPRYYELGVGWVNSTSSTIFPNSGQNFSSRVNLAASTELPHHAFFEFELPDQILGIDAFGTYYVEHSGPAGSPNGASWTKLKVDHLFGVPADSAYFSTNLRPVGWDIVGGATKTFQLSPGGPITIEVRRDLETDAIAAGPLLRLDLIRVRKIPTDPVVAVNVPTGQALLFPDVNIKDPAGPTGRDNKRELTIASRGEKELLLRRVSLRSGQRFSFVNPLPVSPSPYPLRAVSGEYKLTVAFTPDKIQPGYADTLEILTNAKGADSLIFVPVAGNGVGGSWTVNDDSPSLHRASHPALGGLYQNTWNTGFMNRWQTQTSSPRADSIGLGLTRLMLPMKYNRKGWFEWYPEIETVLGQDSVYVRVVATLPLNLAIGSPAARYKVYSAAGNLTKDTIVSQNALATAGPSKMAEIDLGSHWFLRGGRDAFRDTVVGAGPGIFGHVRLEVDTASVNFAGNDTLALVADAIVLRELEAPLITVGVEGPSELPVEFALSQNYPNPFNPTTSIQFALPKSVNVELKIYDLLGREVRTLVRGDQLPAGFHSVVWDGRNEHQQIVATGVYFYRIVAGDFRHVKKMLMLK